MRKVNQNYGAGSRKLGIFDFRFGIWDFLTVLLIVDPSVGKGFEISEQSP